MTDRCGHRFQARGLWEDVWDVFNQQFIEVYAQLRQCNRTLWWSWGHSDNERFPFRAHATFGRDGVAGGADAVIAVDFMRIPSGLSYRADLSRESGEILVDGPEGSVTITADPIQVRKDVMKATEAMARFIAGLDTMLRELICDRPSEGMGQGGGRFDF
jgi:hypothetical protein